MFNRCFSRYCYAKQAVLTLAALCATVTLSPAQSYYGGLRGTIQDQNGGVIASAKVSLINEGTSEQRSVISTQTGGFVFSELVPASYTVLVESPGFKKFDRKGIVVGTQQQVSVDLKLDVGQVTETVEVTESAPLVESANASQGQVLDNQKLTELPNLGRNPFMLSKLVQNVMPVGNPAYNRMEDQSGSSSISIAGGPVRGNNYLIDGVPITDSANRAIIIPTLEAVQEVKVQANTYSAEMARTGGGMFNTLMRSGANEYHGSLYGHLRRTDWDANSFFNNAAGRPITNQPNDTWGASFGGKVSIPKLYDGKNKTFFFLGYEHYDDIQSSSNTYATPTLLERAGDFSQSKNADGSPLIIYDPQNVVNGVRQPFPGNKIPTNRLNPVGLAIAGYYQPPTNTASFFGDSNLAAPGQLPCRAAQYTGKLDEDFTQWWRGSLSYLRYFSLEPGNTEFPTASSPNQWRLLRRVDATQLNNLFTLNPTTVLTVRYGFNRFPNFSYDASQGFDLSSLGFNPNYVSQIPKSLSQYPVITTNNFYQTAASDDNSYYDLSSHNFSADISKYWGRHNIKAGFDYRKISAAGADANNAGGEFVFNGKFTASKGQSGTGGADLADMLLGYPSDGFQYTATKLSEFINYYGAFIQDDIRVGQKLTVNVGLRWERELGLQEQHNGILVGFDANAVNPLGGKGAVEYAGANGKTAAGNPTENKWGPRVGIAYQLNAKTILRTGYGIFWAPQYLSGSPIATVGYNQTTEYFATADNFTTPANNLTNPFPNGILQPVGQTLGAATGIGSTFSLIDPAAKSPYVQQFSFDVQRELPFGIAAEVGYVGSRSKHLVLGAAAVNGNALNPDLLSTIAALPSTTANPYYRAGGPGFIGSQTVSTYQLYLPFPTFGAINKTFSDFNKARYDSMVFKAQKRFSHGMTFLSTLTWSRNKDESGGGVANTLNPGNKGPQNPYDLNSEYGFSNIDSPWRWATSISYELPFGSGKRFVNTGGVANWIVGGWSINTVSIFQTGFPLQIYQTDNNSPLGYAVQRPNATGVSPVTSGSLDDRLNNYINKAAFSTAPEYTFGDISRTLDMRGPGQVNWDMSLFKNFVFKERVKAQYRLEALNAMNTPFFYGPNTNFSSGSFGKITSQANFSRQLQMAVRISF